MNETRQLKLDGARTREFALEANVRGAAPHTSHDLELKASAIPPYAEFFSWPAVATANISCSSPGTCTH